jgi:hypothetical protein
MVAWKIADLVDAPPTRRPGRPRHPNPSPGAIRTRRWRARKKLEAAES